MDHASLESIPEERNYIAPCKKRLRSNSEEVNVLEALEIDGERKKMQEYYKSME